MPAGFRLYFFQNYGVQQAQADEKAQHTYGYVSIYRRSATQPLGLRWGFETTSNHIAAYQDVARPNENKYCRIDLKIIKSSFAGDKTPVKAMLLNKLCAIADNPNPLELVDVPDPVPRNNEILIKISTCGVCHTELDEIEGRTPPPKLPVILGHQIVGRVEQTGNAAAKFRRGDRVGIAWIHSACGNCSHCRRGSENLCDHFEATGRDVHGGYAQYTTVHEDFAYKIPDAFTDFQAAPLLCAGAIGYRSLRLSGLEDHQNLGLTGFGASAHLVLKMVRHKHPNTNVFVFARSAR